MILVDILIKVLMITPPTLCSPSPHLNSSKIPLNTSGFRDSLSTGHHLTSKTQSCSKQLSDATERSSSW